MSYTINTITKMINGLMEKVKNPLKLIPAFLLACITIRRTGSSAMNAASTAIEYCKAIGIPTDENEDGTPNLVNQYTYAITKAILDEIKNNGLVQIVIPKNTLVIQSTGTNSGGPMVSFGTNKTDTLARGIVR